MDIKAGKLLEEVAVKSLEKCAAKLSRISSGAWSVSRAAVSFRGMEEAMSLSVAVVADVGFGENWLEAH